jgi:Protein of unknown function (DUF3015)
VKKTIVAGCLLAFIPVSAEAVGNHPMAGCGLAYFLYAHRDNAKATQIFGATTNASFGTQTFGISSGTSGCTEDGAVKLAKETEVFAAVNLSNLRQNMAAGEGPYAAAFARLLGATKSQETAMLSFFQIHYPALFPSASTSAQEMLMTLSKELAQHPVLG